MILRPYLGGEYRHKRQLLALLGLSVLLTGWVHLWG